MNKAILIFFFCFSIVLSGCSRRFVVDKPELKKFEFKRLISSVTFFDGYYYLLTDYSDLYRFDKKANAFDSTYLVDFEPTDSYQTGLSSIYAGEDDIRGENSYKTYLLKEKRWKYLRKIAEEYPGNKILEDEDYIVSSICHGEFGGIIFFKRKTTGKVYQTWCTCAFDVQKSNIAYFVTSTLGHGGGSVHVLKIDDPTKLPPYNPNDFKKGYWQGKDGKIFDLGKVTIFKTYSQLCVGKFVKEGKAYFVLVKTTPVMGDFVQLGIYTIENNSMKLTQEIKSEYFDSFTEFWSNRHPHPFVTYQNDKNTGFIDFSGGEVVFYNFPQIK